MRPVRRRNETERGAAHDLARSSESSDDAALGARARAGDREAFGCIYTRHAPAVHGVLLALAPARDVHDLLQDVFLQAWRSIDALDDPRRLGPWLLAIARNRVRDHLRSAAHAARANAVDGDAIPGQEERDSDADEEEARRALAAIRALPESYRETLVLRLVEGLSGPEIAARTGMTHGSVRVNLTRGMKLLRERLDAHDVDRARRPDR